MADRLPPGQGALQNWNNINSNKPEEYSSEFTVDGIRYANVTNVSTGQRQLYFVQSISGARGAPITTTNADGTKTPGGTYDNFNRNNPGKLAAAEAASKQASIKLLSTPGISTPAEAAAIKNSKEFKSTTAGSNVATGTGADGTTPAAANTAALNEEFKAGDREGTRNSYGDFKYPLDLKLEVQDVIKFSILKYVPSLSTTGQSTISKTGRIVTLKDGIPIVGGSEKIGTITLPIPAGINDSNTVSWQQDTLNQLQEVAAKTAKGFFEGGVEGGAAAGDGAIEDKTSDPKALKQAISGLLMSVATQGGNIQGRAYGSVNNNNLEVLFGGPGLRSFSFQFSFYPREPNEAIEVRKIIRTFKQSMSVKRSANSLLLKAPHTFAISYLTAGQKAHPYLNRFKECALTSCNIDYTPDGTYMTYGGDEKSMTAYRMTLSFSELEPIFDDEYGESDYDNIGF
jgi:hypothetical protein